MPGTIYIYKYCAVAGNSSPETHVTNWSVRVHALNWGALPYDKIHHGFFEIEQFLSSKKKNTIE